MWYKGAIYVDLTRTIIGCAMNVHSKLGNGYQEVIYQRSLEIEFKIKNLSYCREKEMPIYFKDFEVGTRRVDFVVENKVIVELKALTKLEEVHIAQALNYLEAFNFSVGLLINFGAKSLEFKRLHNTKV